MKNKLISIVMTMVLTLVPVLILPSNIGYYNLLKIAILLISGVILLITTLIRGKDLKIDLIDILIFIFGVLAIISTIFSVNIEKSIIGETNRYEGLLTIITYILIYYNSKYYFKEYKNFQNIILYTYIGICIIAIVQFYMPINVKILPIFGKGANGTFGNTNFMGSFISIALPVFILKYIFKNEKKYLIASGIGFSAMIMCIARSSWVAFAIYMFLTTIYLIINRKKELWKRYMVLIIIFILCFGIITVPKQKDKNNTVLQKINLVKTEIKDIQEKGITNKNGSSRIRIWKNTSKILLKAPIFGCGVDALKDALIINCPEEVLSFLRKYGGFVDKAHNEYLQIAVTMGIPAITIYLGAVTLILLPNMKKSLKSEESMLISTVIISYLAQAFFNISTIGVAPIYWFILGAAARYLKE